MFEDLSLISFLFNLPPMYQYLISLIFATIITTNFYCMLQHFIYCMCPNETQSPPVADTTVCDQDNQSNDNYCFSIELEANEWETYHPLITKYCQSPINICRSSTNMLERHYSLRWRRYEEIPEKIILTNNGSTIVLTCLYNLPNPPSITQIDQQYDEYYFKCIKFRFGMRDADGSEHMIDDRKYPMEMQITHETRRIRNQTKTLIVSYFFNIVLHDNFYLDPIINNLAGLDGRNAEIVLVNDTFPLAWLIPQFETGYFSYCGSLTEPPYTEDIFWIVQPEPLAVSNRQMQCFRRLLMRNYFSAFHHSRPVQNVNMRNIFYNIPERCRGNIHFL